MEKRAQAIFIELAEEEEGIRHFEKKNRRTDPQIHTTYEENTKRRKMRTDRAEGKGK